MSHTTHTTGLQSGLTFVDFCMPERDPTLALLVLALRSKLHREMTIGRFCSVMLPALEKGNLRLIRHEQKIEGYFVFERVDESSHQALLRGEYSQLTKDNQRTDFVWLVDVLPPQWAGSDPATFSALACAIKDHIDCKQLWMHVDDEATAMFEHHGRISNVQSRSSSAVAVAMIV